jgi:large subunit ribosomal protein L24e
MVLAKCVFCGKEQEDYKGTYLMKNDGSANYYCSSKCNKSHINLGRDRRKIRWTEAFHVQREKRLKSEGSKKVGKN